MNGRSIDAEIGGCAYGPRGILGRAETISADQAPPAADGKQVGAFLAAGARERGLKFPVRQVLGDGQALHAHTGLGVIGEEDHPELLLLFVPEDVRDRENPACVRSCRNAVGGDHVLRALRST